jgi:hypothetical protein
MEESYKKTLIEDFGNPNPNSNVATLNESIFASLVYIYDRRKENFYKYITKLNMLLFLDVLHIRIENSEIVYKQLI